MSRRPTGDCIKNKWDFFGYNISQQSDAMCFVSVIRLSISPSHWNGGGNLICLSRAKGKRFLSFFCKINERVIFHRFDLAVNGGGAITLQFQRSPLNAASRTIYVPWNEILTLNPVVMTSTGGNADSAAAEIWHDSSQVNVVQILLFRRASLGKGEQPGDI